LARLGGLLILLNDLGFVPGGASISGADDGLAMLRHLLLLIHLLLVTVRLLLRRHVSCLLLLLSLSCLVQRSSKRVGGRLTLW